MSKLSLRNIFNDKKINLLNFLMPNKRMTRENSKSDNINWILVEKCLSIIGLWPYENKYNIKYILSVILACANAISFIVGYFNMQENITIISAMLWPKFTIHIVIELLLLKVNENSGKILFDMVYKHLMNLNKISRRSERNISQNYHEKMRRILYITLGFPILAAIGLTYEPINDVVSSHKQKFLIFPGWYPISSDLSPNYEIIILSQLLEIFIATVTLASLNVFSGLFILHCCEQIELLCDNIKNYQEKYQHRENFHNENEFISLNCLCLKCIVNRHNKLIDLVKLIDNYLHGIMMRQLFTGIIDFCTIGYKTIENYHDNDTVTILTQFIFLGILCSNFLIFCWLGSDLLEKNNKIGREIYNLKWYNFSYKNKWLIIMMTNRVQRPMKITAAKYFTISLNLYKNWVMSSLQYLSVLAATRSRS